MVKWWTNYEPLTEDENALATALYQAHAACVFRPNCSTAACQQAAGGSRSLTQSYIAALATLGEMHGPVEAAYGVLQGIESSGLFIRFDAATKVPGWGNSFVKGRIDDAFLPVDQILEARFPRTHSKLREVTDALHAGGKRVFPNPGAYTAATAIILGMPRHLAPMLFVQARIEAWACVFHQTVSQLMKPIEQTSTERAG